MRLKDNRGLQYLAHLLRHPGQEILALDVVQAAQFNPRPETADASRRASAPEPLLDAQAQRGCRQRLRELRGELTEAEDNHDVGAVERARTEIEMLAMQLRGALGLGGRARGATTDLERARSAAGKRIRGAIKRIRAVHPVLGRHLKTTVTTGSFCAYQPERDVVVAWEL